jgi:Leucine-rich repeat (LRR) protein
MIQPKCLGFVAVRIPLLVLFAAVAAALLCGCSGGAPNNIAQNESSGVWTDTELAKVRSGEQTTLTAPNATVTDADLAKLADLTKLEKIDFDSVKITDAGLAHLSGLVKLKSLRVRDQDPGHCEVGDTGIASLAKLTELEELFLPSPKATDAAAESIAKLTKIKKLNLNVTQFTDAGIAKLATLPDLDFLRLGSAKLTDKSLEHFAAMSKLEHLNIHDSPITDANLLQLAALAKLNSFYIDRTKITEEGLSKLMEKKPELHVHDDGKHIGDDHHEHHP